MKIRTRLNVISAVSITATVFIVAVFVWSRIEQSVATENERLVVEIQKITIERSLLRDEYLFYGSRRAQTQWQLKTEYLGKLLDQAAGRFRSEKNRDILSGLRRHFDTTGRLWSLIVKNREAAGLEENKKLLALEYEKRLFSQILLEAYALSDSTMKLIESARHTARSRERMLNLVTSLMVGALAAIIFFSSAFMRRLVSRRIEVLHEGVKNIGSGNLDYRIDLKGNDELCELADASNRMAERLKESYTSIEDLQTEIKERIKSEEKYRTVVKTAMDGFWLVDVKGRILDVNDAYCRITGYSREEILSMHVNDLETIEGPEETAAHIKQIIDHGSDRFETRHRARDGRLIDIEISTSYRKEGGGFFAFLRDISERKKAEEKVRALHSELELRVEKRTALLNAITEVFRERLRCETEEELGKVCIATAEQLTGSRFGIFGELNPEGLFDTIAISDPGWDACSTAVLDARKYIESMPVRGIDRAAMREGASRIINGIEAVRNHPDHVATPEGHPEIFSFLGVPLKHKGVTFGMIGLANKVGGYTDEDRDNIETLSVAMVEALKSKQAEERIIKLNASLNRRSLELEAANRELEAFSYSVSHDLKAPLRAIDGFSNILNDEYFNKLDDEGKRLLKIIIINTQNMSHLIDDLLSFSRLSRKQITAKPVDMNRLIQNVVEELHPEISARKVEINIGDLPSVTGDRPMIRQVLLNLLSNALKFTRPQKHALIEAGTILRDDEVIYYIKDNGVGFDMRYSDKLFGVFQRLHSSSEFEGTGVGLAIVQRIIHRHGGRVWAEGEVNRGAAFYFSFPRNHFGTDNVMSVPHESAGKNTTLSERRGNA